MTEAVTERLCDQCGKNPIPKGRRLFCSERCYRRANSRQNSAAKSVRNRRRREQIEIIDRAVRAIHALNPYYGHSKVAGWAVRWEMVDWAGRSYYFEVGKPMPRRRV